MHKITSPVTGPLTSPITVGLAGRSTLNKGAGGFNVAGLPLWSSAVRTKQAPRVLAIGDSTTRGQSALGVNTANNDVSASFPTQLAAKTFGGLSSQWGNILATGNLVGSTYATFDNRFTVGDGFTVDPSAFIGFGGRSLSRTAAGSYGTFRAAEVVNVVEVEYLQQPGSGIIGISIDGAPNVEVNTDGVLAYKVASVPVSSGVHSVTVSHVSGSLTRICGFNAYNSAVKQVQIFNAGVPGITAVGTTVNGNNPHNPYAPSSFELIDPDLTIICLGKNDGNAATPTTESVFKASIQRLINNAIAVGSDVLLVVPTPSNTANALANQAAFQTYLHDLATLNGLPIVDFIALWGSWSAANALGWFRDDLHPNSVGYGKKADAIGASIGAA